MSRVVKRKIHKIKPVIEYSKRGRPHGKAAVEMQSYIGVLARTIVPLVDKKWTQLPKDLKEHIWEVVEMAYVVGQGFKKIVPSSAAKKWKDFKSILTRQFILPFTNDKEKLKEPPQLYNFIEKLKWDAFVASRLFPEFEAVHSEQSQRSEKCEYNHRLSRKGYVGLEDELEEAMNGEEINRSLLWKKVREDKHGNIPDPKVAEGKINWHSDCLWDNDIFTLSLGTPEHGGRVRGVGAGVSPNQFFNLSRHQRVKFVDKLKESVMEAVREESMWIEARAKEPVLEAVRAEREIMLKQFSQLIPNFDPNMLKIPIAPILLLPQEQSPTNPTSDKASCSGATNVKPLVLGEENAKNDADAAEKQQDEMLDLPPPLLALCHFVQTKLPKNETVKVNIPGEVFGYEHDTFILPDDILQVASMVEIGSTVIVVYMRYLFEYIKMANIVSLVDRLEKADGDQFFFVPYNPSHWVLIIVRPAKETVYYMDSLSNRSVDEDMRNIVNTAIKMYNSHVGKQSHSRLLGLKSHDCHILMQQLLHVAIRSVLEKPGRYTKILKGYVQNRTRPEGCIAERYIAEEAIEFCTEHLSDVSTIGVPSSQKMGVSKTLSGCTVSLFDRDLLNQAHLYVLENTEEVLPYIEEHMMFIKTTYPKFRRRIKWLQDKHNSTFIQWLHFQVQSELGEENNDISENLSAKDKNPIVSNMRFYGVIQEVWDLDYQKFRIPVLRCDWIDNTSGLVVDELGFTLVDLSKNGHRNDQFVIASQVKQVFFVDDPMYRGWSVVLSMPNIEYNDVIDDDVLGDIRIECEPFTRGIPNVDTFDDLVGEFESENIRDECGDMWID
ncbi:hypothetical protein L3X38_027993 [Prunus dulcis]|uniref:Ubiquitin-like protease family profile domain-containing protein n=1 Tax=Prunus dulcis TaxID=3755 RepID=A0AAD4Z0S5_PRUDU|nr:hypothetical protein L3X38_027993 [Prunus dulcis]